MELRRGNHAKLTDDPSSYPAPSPTPLFRDSAAYMLPFLSPSSLFFFPFYTTQHNSPTTPTTPSPYLTYTLYLKPHNVVCS